MCTHLNAPSVHLDPRYQNSKLEPKGNTNAMLIFKLNPIILMAQLKETDD
jgi:hypothetical protein